MSAELDITNGTASFVSANLVAWHRLGTVFDGLLTVEDALREAHLAGWNVRKAPSFGRETILTADGVTTVDVPTPGRYAVHRTNPITGATDSLGNVGEDYKHFQNEETAEFLRALLDQSGAFIETAGALRGGRRVFYSAKLPTEMLVGGVDPINLFATVLNSHDGSTGLRALVSPVRVVCANTERAALASAKQFWSIKHTEGGLRAASEAARSLELTWKYAAAFEQEAERMIQTTITNGEFDLIAKQVLDLGENTSDTKRTATGKIRKFAVVADLFRQAPTQETIRGTRWAAYNALTEYVDHFVPVRVAGPESLKAERRALQAVDGGGIALKERAFDLLRVPELAGAGG